jgi:MFS family permease
MAVAATRGPLRALRSRRFAAYWAAQTVSIVADRAYLVAFTVQLGVIDHRPGLLATALATTSITFTAPMLLAGAIVDRLGTRLVLFTGDAIRAAATLALAVGISTGHTPTWLWIIVAGGIGLGESLFYPGYGTVIAELVSDQHLASANGLRVAAHTFGSTVGPLVTALLVHAHALSIAFWAQGATFLIAAVAAFVIPIRAASSAGMSVSTLRSALEGARYVFRQRWLVVVFAIAFCVNLAIEGPRFVLLPLHAASRNGLGLGASGFAWLAAAGGVGAFAGSLWWGRRERGVGDRARALTICLLLLGVGWCAVGFSSPAVALCAIAIAGVGIAGVDVVQYSVVQVRVPRELLGRTLSLLEVATSCSGPLSYLVAGLLIGVVAPGIVLIAAGAVIIVLGIAVRAGVLDAIDR